MTSVSNMFSGVSPTVHAMRMVERTIAECRPPLGALSTSPFLLVIAIMRIITMIIIITIIAIITIITIITGGQRLRRRTRPGRLEALAHPRHRLGGM